MGDGRWEMGDGRWEMGDGRWEMEMGDGRWEMGDGTVVVLSCALQASVRPSIALLHEWACRLSSHCDGCRASKIGLSKEQQVEQGLASGGYEVGGAHEYSHARCPSQELTVSQGARGRVGLFTGREEKTPVVKAEEIGLHASR